MDTLEHIDAVDIPKSLQDLYEIGGLQIYVILNN